MLKNKDSLQKTNIGFDLSSKLAEIKISANYKKTINFFENMTSDRLYSLTGLYKNQFDDLCNVVCGKSFQSVNNKDAIGFYLVKYRLGLSIKKTCDIANICSYFQAKQLIIKVREVLIEKLVPLNLGFQHLSRQEIIEKHTTILSKKLFNVGRNSLAVVWDGTYCFIEKSSNYSFFKRSYSMHKNRHLLKMMLVVTTKGKTTILI